MPISLEFTYPVSRLRYACAAVNGDNGRCRLEILVFYLTKFTAINRVSKPGAKILHLKPVRSAANLLIRRKTNADLSMGNLFVGKQISGSCHNFRYAGPYRLRQEAWFHLL